MAVSNVGKLSRIGVLSNITNDNLYLDPDYANALKKDMDKQLTKLHDVTAKIVKLINQAVNDKTVKGAVYTKSTQNLVKALKKRSSAAAKWEKQLDSKFTSDTQDYVTQYLTKQISALESRIAELEAASNQIGQ